MADRLDFPTSPRCARPICAASSPIADPEAPERGRSGRGLAGIRSLLRFLERRGLANAAGATALRAPRQPKSLPKPLTASDARRVVSFRRAACRGAVDRRAQRRGAYAALRLGPAHFRGARRQGRRTAGGGRAARHRQGRQDAADAGSAVGAASGRGIPQALPVPSRPERACCFAVRAAVRSIRRSSSAR